MIWWLEFRRVLFRSICTSQTIWYTTIVWLLRMEDCLALVRNAFTTLDEHVCEGFRWDCNDCNAANVRRVGQNPCSTIPCHFLNISRYETYLEYGSFRRFEYPGFRCWYQKLV